MLLLAPFLFLSGLLAYFTFILVGGTRMDGASIHRTRRVLYIVVAIVIGALFGYLIFFGVLWIAVHLFPPFILVDGVEKERVMPIAQMLFSFCAAIVAGIACATVAYRALIRRST